MATPASLHADRSNVRTCTADHRRRSQPEYHRSRLIRGHLSYTNLHHIDGRYPATAAERARIATEPASAGEIELIPATSPPVSAYALEEMAAREANRRHREARGAEAERLALIRAQAEEDARRQMAVQTEGDNEADEAGDNYEDCPDVSEAEDELSPRQNVQPDFRNKQESKLDSWIQTRLPELVPAGQSPERERSAAEQQRLLQYPAGNATRTESTPARQRPFEPIHSPQEQIAHLLTPWTGTLKHGVKAALAAPRMANSKEAMANARAPVGSVWSNATPVRAECSGPDGEFGGVAGAVPVKDDGHLVWPRRNLIVSPIPVASRSTLASS